jgi:hypothetical protein
LQDRPAKSGCRLYIRARMSQAPTQKDRKVSDFASDVARGRRHLLRSAAACFRGYAVRRSMAGRGDRTREPSRYGSCQPLRRFFGPRSVGGAIASTTGKGALRQLTYSQVSNLRLPGYRQPSRSLTSCLVDFQAAASGPWSSQWSPCG